MGNSLSSGTIEINNFEELLEFAEAGVKPGQKQLKLSPELVGYWLSTSKEKVTGTSSLENNYGLCGKSKKIFSD